jgi:DNA-binding response OmpR family regulator
MRLLVVEDDAPLADMLVRCLREESYAVDHASDGQEAEWMVFENPYDAIILDLMLPRKHGLQVLDALRKGGVTTPVLILTAQDSTEDRVSGLDQGADDYLTKPFSLEEVLARVRALLRRREHYQPPTLAAGPLSLNAARREVTLHGHFLDLTAKEYSLLHYFIVNQGQVLSRTQLSEHVWDVNFEPTSNVVDVYIGYLRAKMDKFHPDPLIKTVRGHGYMLDVTVTDETKPEWSISAPAQSAPAQESSHVHAG